MEHPAYEGRPASQNSIFADARAVADYDRNLKMRGLGPAEGKELDAPNLAVPRDKSIDIGARLDMAVQIRKPEQQERKEHKKGWFKYMPW